MPKNMSPERDCNVTKTPEEQARLTRQAKSAARYLDASGNRDVAVILGIEEYLPAEGDNTDKGETT